MDKKLIILFASSILLTAILSTFTLAYQYTEEDLKNEYKYPHNSYREKNIYYKEPYSTLAYHAPSYSYWKYGPKYFRHPNTHYLKPTNIFQMYSHQPYYIKITHYPN